jgi:hypothetical protein
VARANKEGLKGHKEILGEIGHYINHDGGFVRVYLSQNLHYMLYIAGVSMSNIFQ